MTDQRPLIVLVDDDRDFLDIHRRILEGGGHRVACFARTDDAWAHMAHENPGLVVVDLMMDSLTAGFSLSKKIKEDSTLKDVPVLLLTGIASERGYDFGPRDAADLQAMSVDAYLAKPVEAKVLLAKVSELLHEDEGGRP